MDDVSTDYLIDGIGNEVTILIACIVIIISLMLAWMSTHVQPIENQHAHYQNNSRLVSFDFFLFKVIYFIITHAHYTIEGYICRASVKTPVLRSCTMDVVFL